MFRLWSTFLRARLRSTSLRCALPWSARSAAGLGLLSARGSLDRRDFSAAGVLGRDSVFALVGGRFSACDSFSVWGFSAVGLLAAREVAAFAGWLSFSCAAIFSWVFSLSGRLFFIALLFALRFSLLLGSAAGRLAAFSSLFSAELFSAELRSAVRFSADFSSVLGAAFAASPFAASP